MVRQHFEAIAMVAAIDIVVFVHPASTDLHIPPPLLQGLCREIESITAIKEWSNDIVIYEDNVRRLAALDRHVSILTAHSRSLLPTLAIGADGILSGHGSVVADLQAQIFGAMTAGDLASARVIAERLWPLTQVVYREPMADMHNRMKTIHYLRGDFPTPYVRPPLCPLGESELRAIRESLALSDTVQAGGPQVSS
jgi:4-hydroxy-tetrahydrodipicolinate synthase